MSWFFFENATINGHKVITCLPLVEKHLVDMNNCHANLEMINLLQKLETKKYVTCNYIQFVDVEARCLLESSLSCHVLL